MRIGQVAAKFNVSPTTLRRWTERFSDFLTEGASHPSNGNGKRGVRDYSETDILVLGAIQAMRERGLDDDAIWAELQAERDRMASNTNGTSVLARVEQGDDLALLGPQAATAALALALRQLSETQQALLNSQQAHRDLLGVVVQDNFNLKEENARLRKQLRQIEQDLAHLKESDWNHRLSLEERMTVLEQQKKSWWQRLLRR